MKDPLIIEMLKLFIKSRHQRRIIPHTSWSMLEHAATSMHTPHSRTPNKYLLIRISDTQTRHIKAPGTTPPPTIMRCKIYPSGTLPHGTDNEARC